MLGTVKLKNDVFYTTTRFDQESIIEFYLSLFLLLSAFSYFS